MARLLYFRSQQIGDHLVRYEPLDAPVTPPAVIAGLWREAAEIDTSSRNMLWSELMVVSLVRATPEIAEAAVAAIRGLQGLRGAVAVRVDGVLKWQTSDQWTLQSVEGAGLAAAFGGRFTPELSMTFIGGDAPQRY